MLLVGAAVAAMPTPSVVQDNLYGTKFVDEHDGWAVGAFGTIVRTTDGGRTWLSQASKTTQQIYDVDFVDHRVGWTVGRSGLVLHTEDGGETWTPQTAGVDRHLFAVDFVDRDFGVVVGDWGAILVTTDGGKTWENHTLEEDVVLNDVSMVDRTHGWIAGEVGTVLATQDGGRTWTRQQTGVDKTFFGVNFVDAQQGWVVGIDALILHTADGGQSWKVLHGSTEIRELEQVGFGMAYENPSLYAIQMIGTFGVAVGEIGAVFVSTDGGRTWQREDPASGDGSGPKWFRSVSMVKGTHGVIVGAHGAQLHIVNGKILQPDGGSSAAQTLH